MIGNTAMVIRHCCVQRRVRVARRRVRTMACVACVGVVVAVLAVGVLGLALNEAAIGEQCSWCSHFACIHLHWWQCNALAGVPQNGCSYTPVSSTTGSLSCPEASITLLLPHCTHTNPPPPPPSLPPSPSPPPTQFLPDPQLIPSRPILHTHTQHSYCRS